MRHDIKILLSSMQHDEMIRSEDTTQLRSVTCQWINNCEPIEPSQLNEGETWEIRFLSMKFGVKRDSVVGLQSIK
jgi:hypothetical protein